MKKSGGTGPTASKMNRDKKKGTLGLKVMTLLTERDQLTQLVSKRGAWTGEKTSQACTLKN